MSTNTWNKKALAALTIAAFVGLMSPISATAWDGSEPDDVVTVSVDLGDGSDGGGGGGGNTCTGYGTLIIPSKSIAVTKERKILKSVWAGDVVDDDTNGSTSTANDDLDGENQDPRNLQVQPVDPVVENTRTAYVSEQFSVGFDADNCVDSQKTGAVWMERQPVERYFTDDGDYWSPQEMTWSDGILGTGVLKATSNLKVDYSLFGVNRNDFPVLETMPWDNPPGNPWNVTDWDTAYSMGPPMIWGSSGETNATAVINIYGDAPQGKWRVKYGFWLDVSDNQNSGPWVCYFNVC